MKLCYSTSNTLRLLSFLTSSSPMTFSPIPCQPPMPCTLEIIITLYHSISKITNSNMTFSVYNLQGCWFNYSHYHYFFFSSLWSPVHWSFFLLYFLPLRQNFFVTSFLIQLRFHSASPQWHCCQNHKFLTSLWCCCWWGWWHFCIHIAKVQPLVIPTIHFLCTSV